MLKSSLNEAKKRVLKNGGRIMCLEFSKVENEVLNKIYKFYSKSIPHLGKYITGKSEPYEYLIKSIEKFYNQDDLLELFKKSGFENVQYRESFRRYSCYPFWLENLIMIFKIYNLFKIIRKLSVSGAVDVIDEIKPIPKFLKFIFYIFSFGSNKDLIQLNKTEGDKLCSALQDMGTTFIKLGQFLATRPDINWR